MKYFLYKNLSFTNSQSENTLSRYCSFNHHWNLIRARADVVGTEIRTVDLRLNKETRKTLISQRSRISANTTRQTIRTQ